MKMEKTFDAESRSRGDWTWRKRRIRTRHQNNRFTLFTETSALSAYHSGRTTSSFLSSLFFVFSASSSATPRLRVNVLSYSPGVPQ
jgi:hypothetical protein